jgi:hypothetical protein
MLLLWLTLIILKKDDKMDNYFRPFKQKEKRRPVRSAVLVT